MSGPRHRRDRIVSVVVERQAHGRGGELRRQRREDAVVFVRLDAQRVYGGAAARPFRGRHSRHAKDDSCGTAVAAAETHRGRSRRHQTSTLSQPSPRLVADSDPPMRPSRVRCVRIPSLQRAGPSRSGAQGPPHGAEAAERAGTRLIAAPPTVVRPGSAREQVIRAGKRPVLCRSERPASARMGAPLRRGRGPRAAQAVPPRAQEARRWTRFVQAAPTPNGPRNTALSASSRTATRKQPVAALARNERGRVRRDEPCASAEAPTAHAAPIRRCFGGKEAPVKAGTISALSAAPERTDCMELVTRHRIYTARPSPSPGEAAARRRPVGDSDAAGRARNPRAPWLRRLFTCYERTKRARESVGAFRAQKVHRRAQRQQVRREN